MKKSLLILAFFAIFLGAAEPKLKIAVVSDIHEKWNELDRVFAFLAAKKTDAVLFGGDLTNGNPQSYKTYGEYFKKYFAGLKKAPVHIPILGNHDYLGHPNRNDRLTAQGSMERFFKPMGLPAKWLQHHQINGYTIIGVSATDIKGEHRFTDAEIKQVSDLIGKAEKAAPGKPVFVLTHCPPSFTLLSSAFSPVPRANARFHWRYDNVRKMLDGHPQAVSISGHTHLALEDERTIWQGEFTAIHGGVLRWVTPIRPTPLSGLIETRDRFRGRNFIYIEVFENKMIIYRFDAETLREIKPQNRWKIALPYHPEKAVYTAKRAEKAVVPEFPENAKAQIIRDGKLLYLKLDRAEHPDMVLAYKLKLTYDNNRHPEQELFVSSDFFIYGQEKDRMLNIDERVKIAPGTGVMEITPYEVFGKAGKTLTSRFAVPELKKVSKGK